MFVLKFLSRVCTHIRLFILEKRLCVYVCVVVEGMYTYMKGNFSTSLCVYVFVSVEGM